MCQQNNRWIRCLVCLFLLFYSSFWISSIGLGGGVVAMVQPIQAPMASIAVKAMRTGVAISQILIDSKAGMKRAAAYEIIKTTQMMKISQPIV